MIFFGYLYILERKSLHVTNPGVALRPSRGKLFLAATNQSNYQQFKKTTQPGARPSLNIYMHRYALATDRQSD